MAFLSVESNFNSSNSLRAANSAHSSIVHGRDGRRENDAMELQTFYNVTLWVRAWDHARGTQESQKAINASSDVGQILNICLYNTYAYGIEYIYILPAMLSVPAR